MLDRLLEVGKEVAEQQLEELLDRLGQDGRDTVQSALVDYRDVFRYYHISS